MNNNSTASGAILIIDSDAQRAGQLRDMIEFLDAPAVQIADVGNWARIADSLVLKAIFIGSGSGSDSALAEAVQQAHPDVPLVVVEGDDA